MPLHPMVTWKDDSIVRDRRGNVRITPEVVADVLACVGNGLSIDRALVKVGVTSAGVSKWRSQNRALDQRFLRAEAEWEGKMVAIIANASAKDWKASTWLLERRAQGWVPVTKAELTGAGGGPLAIMTLSRQIVGSLGVQPDAVPRPRDPKALQEYKAKQ